MAVRNCMLGLIAALLSLAGVNAVAGEELVLRDVRIVNVVDGTVSEPQTVVIEGEIIVGIGPSESASSGSARTFDGAGRYLIPGLWDSHVHLFTSETEPDWALSLYVLHGVTGVRDMGALWPMEAMQTLAQQVAEGIRLGPRLIISGAWVDGSPGSWPGMFTADTPLQAREVVDQIAAQGWAAVKAYSMLLPETYVALADESKAHGLPLVGHIPETVSLPNAIEAGQDGMEHWGRVTQACSPREAELVDEMTALLRTGADQQALMAQLATHNGIVLRSWDESLCRDIIKQMANARLHVSPTLVVADFYLGNWPPGDAPRMQMLPAEVRAAWGEGDFRLDAMTDEVRALAKDSVALDRRTFRLAHEAGVPILASTDASFANPYIFHGASLIDELLLYVEVGLSPREALYTATVAPPRFFGLKDQDGTIMQGRRGDLVLLAENPLEGLETLRSPEAVIVGGRLLDRATLDSMAEGLLALGAN